MAKVVGENVVVVGHDDVFAHELWLGLVLLAYFLFTLRAHVLSLENRFDTKVSSLENIINLHKIEYAHLVATIDTLRKTSTAFADSRKLDISPFDCDGQLCTANNKYFCFPKGVIIGTYNTNCEYEEAVLSIDLGDSSTGNGKNCPSGDGSITLLLYYLQFTFP